ncbi:MAG: peptide-methionine (R)-S-oxide reductase MsrB [Cytophagales bacterium]|nr:peptide-methionine (R)-S-oxide reductase MsrB [Armatimonadota bacterium]
MTTNRRPVNKTEAEWRSELTPEQYRVLRQAGTERPFTGEYWNHKEDGSYTCAACGAVLFGSDTKFDSHCGWPSFFEAFAPDTVELKSDQSHGMTRVEALCRNCGSHLGHLFDDAPQTPTGQRYCINSASLNFQKNDPT